MKILFVMEKRVNAGSIQAVANYVRAGAALGHRVAVLGTPDPNFPDVRFSVDVEAFDAVVFLLESSLRWFDRLWLTRILTRVPRERRFVLDADGMYNRVTVAAGGDCNHADERGRAYWRAHIDALADRVMQPTLEPREPSLVGLPFYGYDQEARARAVPGRCYDLLHLGHNWWRGHEMDTVVLPAIARARHRLGGVCFVGLWWDAVPAWATTARDQAPFRMDFDRFRELGIEVRPPVPYTEVIATMGQGRVNLMTQRPLFRQLRILTSKYFEIFSADSIPLVVLDPDHAAAVYGPAGRELALCDGSGDKLLDVLARPQRYREVVEEVRRHLRLHHSYPERVRELVAALVGRSSPAERAQTR
jgi:hypothetical protein